ncbi:MULTISPECIES: glycerol-3-phosphate dehydrogenase/oxidase [Arcobacteraceae]|uniref:Glycerol-3-phosphate dehydrogenase n=1 Tax=Poseidonibacter parvus TaxID=1850254 RepID=A0A1P8KMM1_9BACT|nr:MULTISPECIES: FAD-dependent oxidoreductase [Arcobacteraceae]APW65812.1 glycerol-3-phosphate dehydrogenase [Poseidonibacter parvus]
MSNEQFDIIIIGGGATGSGIALDAASRGFKTLLLEKNDFSEGTSSRSTKMVHGGVRYLEAAVKKLDKDQFNLVKEGLKERSRLLKNAPHLCTRLTLVTPLYKWWEIPYMFTGLFLYDFISGKRGLGRTSVVSKNDMINTFPTIKKKGLVGGIKYYDGSFNDSRLNITLLQTAEKYGAICKNYSEVKSFIYTNDKISGLEMEDKITGKTYTYNSTSIINATGAFSDKVRKMDDKEAAKMLDLSSGVHIVLDKKYLPSNEGLMIPKTQDGRVLFILPWMGKCLVGTTDEKTILSEHPEVSQKDLDYILEHLEIYFDLKIDKSEILSSWSGIRPLVSAPKSSSTKSIVRDHIITSSNSGLISIIGGKWTTYRKMAEEVVDYTINKFNLSDIKCKTKELKLIGSEIQSENLKIDFVEKDIKEYLIKMYGDKALLVAQSTNKIQKLHPKYCLTNAEVLYSIKYEFVKKPLDFLVRRTSLSLIDKKASIEILEEVLTILKDALSWDEETLDNERLEALSILNKDI